MSTDLHRQFEEEGYVVVRGVYDADRASRLLEVCNSVLAQWREKNPETGEPGGGPEAVVMRHLNHPEYHRQNPEGLNLVMDAIADTNVLDAVHTLFGEPALFRCTSMFFNPLENNLDGNWHRDSQFMTPDDEAEKGMLANPGFGGCQMQVALVPSDDVEYVPGSHLRWDAPEEYEIRKADDKKNNRSNSMPGALRLALEPGDAACFNAMGLHRGRYHADRLRRTFMLTYTRKSIPHYDYFSHQPWFLEPGYLEGLRPETRKFFELFVDVYQGDWAKKAG